MQSPASFQKYSNNNYGKSVLTHHCFAKASDVPFSPLKDCSHMESNMDEHEKSVFFNFSACSSFFETKLKAAMTIYPNSGKENKCTLMLLTNLAEAEWIPVDCRTGLASDLLCENRTDVNSDTHNIAGRKICSVWSFQFDGKCYLFMWYNCCVTSSVEISDLCFENKKGSSIVKTKIFQIIFDAVSVSPPPFLMIDNAIHNTTIRKITYNKYWSIKELKQNTANMHSASAEGFLICISNQSKTILGAQLFQCLNGTTVSLELVCDGRADCVNDHSDETDCSPVASPSGPSTVVGQNNMQANCSYLEHVSADNSCQKYLLMENNGQVRQKAAIDEAVAMCNKRLVKQLLDDLVADCGSAAQDEPLLLSLLENYQYFACRLPGQVPCKEGHPKCYNVSEICIYTLDLFGHMYTCRNGGHLEQCSTFQCNMMFKCKNSYCVPWSLVCDGHWDCAFGDDEMYRDICGAFPTCTDLFKCKNASRCIHLGTVCDGRSDCPLGDDEFSCKLKRTQCPAECFCLLFAMNCHNATLTEAVFHLPDYPHVYLSVSTSFVSHIMSLLRKFPLLLYLMLVNGHVSEVCGSIFPPSAIKIDFSFNQIIQIGEHCFVSLKQLKSLLLSHNNISSLNTKSFSNLQNLTFLELSNNPLVNVPKGVFTSSCKLTLVSLRQVCSQAFEEEAFMGLSAVVLEVTDFHLCCIAPSKSKCTSAAPWYFSCQCILPDTKTKVISTSACVAVFVFNGISVLVHVFLDDSAQSYLLTVLSVHLANGLFLLYLRIILIADATFGWTFVLKEELWRSSSGCFAAFQSLLWFTLESQLVILFWTCSKMMVVIFPIQTQFKRKKFVVKSLSFLSVVSLFLTAATTLSVRYVEGRIPTSICSPFFDPADLLVTIKVTTWFAAITQCSTVLAAFIMHILLLHHLIESQKKLKNSKSDSSSNMFLMIQLVMITLSKTLSWLPADAVFVASMFLVKYPVSLVMWTTVAMTPINCVVIPAICVGTIVRQVLSSKDKHTAAKPTLQPRNAKEKA